MDAKAKSIVRKKVQFVKRAGSYFSETPANRLEISFFKTFGEVSCENKELNDIIRKSRKSAITTNESLEWKYGSSENLRVISSERKQALYREFVYATMYRAGIFTMKGLKWTDDEIYAYGRKVFSISDEDHQLVCEDVASWAPPECVLSVKVVGAEEIGAGKGSSDASLDTFCELALLFVEEPDSLSKKKCLRDICLPSKIFETKVVEKSSSPIWDEVFQLNLYDAENQVIRLDLRVKKNDECIGMVEISLKDLDEFGLDNWFDLESRNPKKKSFGKIHVQISIIFNHTLDSSLLQNQSTQINQVYRDFLTCFAYYDWQEYFEGRKINLELSDQKFDSFDFEKTEAAEIGLTQLVIQNRLSKLTVSVLQWIVYSKMFVDVGTPLQFLVELLQTYQKLSEENNNENMEEDGNDFISSLRMFVTFTTEELLTKYRYAFNAECPSRCMELGRLIMCLSLIFNLPIYKARVSVEVTLFDRLTQLVIQSTNEWFKQMKSCVDVADDTVFPKRIDGMIQLSRLVLVDLKNGKDSYNSVFKAIKMEYFTLVCKEMDVLLSSVINVGLREMGDELKKDNLTSDFTSKTYELYTVIQDIYKLSNVSVESRQEGLRGCLNLFRESVTKWITLACVEAKLRIDRALEYDEVLVIDETVKHSTSAVDASCCLAQICSFWNDLQWIDVTDGYMFLIHITEVIGECGIHYAENIYTKCLKDCCSAEGTLLVNDQFPLMINNIYYIVEFMKEIPEKLGFGMTLSSMTKLHGNLRFRDFNGTLLGILNCAKADMENKVRKVMTFYGGKMKEVLITYLKHILHLEAESFEESLDEFLEFLDKNLAMLNAALLSQGFEKLLLKLWIVFLSCNVDFIEVNRTVLRPSNYTNLKDLFECVKGIFHADNSGIPRDKLISSSNFLKLKGLIEINMFSTENLIQRYFSTRCEMQKNATDSNSIVGGSIAFKMFYSLELQKLIIKIMNCKSIIPMDLNGLSDPYIVVSLKPDHLFPRKKKKQTKVVKKTLFPLFDEVLQFSISADDCLRFGATAVFTLFDWNAFSSNEMVGEAYYSLNHAVGLMKDAKDGFEQLPLVELPFFFKPNKSDIVDAIENRVNYDPLASSFTNERNDRRIKISNNLKKGKQIMSSFK